MTDPSAPPRSVGLVAVQLGLITREQLQAAQKIQARTPGKTIDQILVEQKVLSPDQMRSLLRETTRHVAPTGAGAVPAAPKPVGPSPGRRFGPPQRASRPVAKVTSAAESRKTWILAGLMGLVPVLGIVGYLMFRGGSGPSTASVPAETPVKAPPRETPKDPPKDLPKDPPSEKKLENIRIRAVLRKIAGHDPIPTRYNAEVDSINSCRDPEQYKPYLPELEKLVKESKGTPCEDDVTDGYREVLAAINKRAEQIFAFLSDEVGRLSAAGKYGEAVKSWDWFPGNLDLAGAYERKIGELRNKTLGEARVYFQKVTSEAEDLIKQAKLADARLILLRALEIGLADLAEEAYKRLAELTRLEDAAARKAEENQLAEFERIKKAEGEATKMVALYQGQFWDLVSRRKLDGAKDFLGKQRSGAPADVTKAIDQMQEALEGIRQAFSLVADRLQAQAGRTVSLAFLENGEKKPRSFLLKSIRDGKIVYEVEGRELSAAVSDLHSSEITKIAGTGSEGDRSFLEGVAKLLEGGFDEAHLHLTSAGPRAAPLVKFIENSTAFLERNVPVMKERAIRHVKDKEWEKAAQEYTKLATIPAERKEALQGRARAYYQMNNFVGTVLDIDTLFGMDDFSGPTIELLNQAYKRSTLIVKAIQIYETANRRVPENADILTNLVALYMQIHEYVKAKETLSRVEKIQGGNSRLGGLVHLLNVALEPSFPGQTFKTQFGRYDLETNVSAEYANKMARFMDRVYQSYVKVFPYKKNETLRFHVKLFASEGEFFSYYKRVTGADARGPEGKILAYYMPATKELVGWNADDIESTLQHEGTHQYIDYFISECPITLNEGYASFFETSTADEVRFNPGRHVGAKHLLATRQLPSLKEVFMMSGDVFRARGAWHYSTSWSMIYYFIKSGRKAILDRYFEALMEGKNQEQAFDAVFGPGKANVEELDAKWRRAIFSENYDE
ncbi:MAG TPA: tetratricopeptide repeat protein [Planctomycetota bacterium]